MIVLIILNKIKLYYIKGRHFGCNCIYLTQDYYQLDKMSIRNNSNIQIFFKLNPKDIQSVHTYLVSLDYTFDQLKNVQ